MGRLKLEIHSKSRSPRLTICEVYGLLPLRTGGRWAMRPLQLSARSSDGMERTGISIRPRQ